MNILHDQQRVPPGFGEGKPWRSRLLTLIEPDGETIPFWRAAGMKVSPNQHDSYFQMRKIAEETIAKRARLGEPGPLITVLVDDRKESRGIIVMHESDGPDELAFVGCMLLELGQPGIIGFGILEMTAEEGRDLVNEFTVLSSALP
jgi:hypothetical protein